MKRIIGSIAAVVVVASGLALAAPASADGVVNLNVRDGIVGVQQTIDAQISTSGVGGTGTVTFTANGQTIGTDDVGPTLGYNAQVYWTPSTGGGRVNITATFSGGGSDSTSVNVAAVSTQTDLSSPGSAATGTTITLTAQVYAKTGSYVPTGNVTFYKSSGSSIGNGNLNNQGIATLAYPLGNASGNVSFYAKYNGDSNAKASNNSATTTTKVSSQGSSVTLSVPQTNYLNTAVPLIATINPNTGTGTVTFTVSGKNVGTANVSGGKASVTWVPTATGNPKVTATYSGGNGVSGSSDSKTVAVAQALKTDTISIDPVGSQGPILNGQTFVLANGASVQTVNSSASGLPVAIAVAGPCSFTTGTSTFTVLGVDGKCTIAASTAGGNGFAPGKLTFYISTTTGTQTANVAAPKSGSYKNGKTLTLAKAGTVTNLNQTITWKVKSGGSYCKISKSKGAVYLKLVKKGKCTVTGTAPAVGTQWAAYSTTRNYTVT
jgi:hypothetical protein